MASASYINGNWQLDQQKTDWRTQARELQSYLPQTIQGDNGYAITMQSLNIIDSRNCELIMKLNMSKSQFTADELSELKEGIEGMTKELESEFGHVPYVTTKLYDSTGSLIYSIKI